MIISQLNGSDHWQEARRVDIIGHRVLVTQIVDCTHLFVLWLEHPAVQLHEDEHSEEC